MHLQYRFSSLNFCKTIFLFGHKIHAACHLEVNGLMDTRVFYEVNQTVWELKRKSVQAEFALLFYWEKLLNLIYHVEEKIYHS